MNEAQALDGLSAVLSELAENPFDFNLHVRHIQTAKSLQGMDSEVISAMEMMSTFYPVNDDIWLTLIDTKEAAVDKNTADGVAELLALFEQAENDYLSIPVLKRHAKFLIEQYSAYATGTIKPDQLGDAFTLEWMRNALPEVVNKGARHLTQGHVLWGVMLEWELELLEALEQSERPARADELFQVILARLKQPHFNSSDTLQAYSTLTTSYKPPDQYEHLLVSASKVRTQMAKQFDRRSNSEDSLVQSGYSLDAYSRYITSERRAKQPDIFILAGVCERAVAEASRQRFQGVAGAEEALRSFWTSYLDAMRINGVQPEIQLAVCARAARSVPSSGQVWARYLRLLERSTELESYPSFYDKAFSTSQLQKDVEQIVPVVLARASFERRRIQNEDADEDTLGILVGTLEAGIDLCRKASKTGDPKLRLEKFLAEIYQSFDDEQSAIRVLEAAAKHYKTSYLAWTLYTDLLIKHDKFDQARTVFKDICMKHHDWPEAVWEAWSSFEYLYGTVDQLEACLDQVEKGQYQVNARRAKEAQSMAAAYQMQSGAESFSQPLEPSSTDQPMDLDNTSERGTKRAAEDDSVPDNSKKARVEPKSAPLKRDRENCTVFVSDLPSQATEDDLKSLFKDCGNIREIKITDLKTSLVGTVEFFERTSIPPALTKDKKRVNGREIGVHLAWQSTLYITNFPESADDAFIRNLLGKYGTILDVRWPSKKFKATRRFCYLQYTQPSSAQNALELHGKELEPGMPIAVYISNPERKKDRTDHDANEREVYVAGLSRFTNKTDLEKLFETYGGVKEVRMALNDQGHSKGFAFIEFDDEKSALAALSANNHELKKRRIAVTLADSRVRARNREASAESGFKATADAKNRSVRIRNLPAGTQEGLLQQVLEKIARVKRVEVQMDQGEAVVELENASEAGKLLLRTEPLVFNGSTLKIIEEGQRGPAAPRPAVNQAGLFIPRTAGPSRPKAGIGMKKNTAVITGGASAMSQSSSTPPSTGSQSGAKGQDDFRRLLAGGK